MRKPLGSSALGRGAQGLTRQCLPVLSLSPAWFWQWDQRAGLAESCVQQMWSCAGCTSSPSHTHSPHALPCRVTAPSGWEGQCPGVSIKEPVCSVGTAHFDPLPSCLLFCVLQASECWMGPSPTAWKPLPSTSTIRSMTSTAAGEHGNGVTAPRVAPASLEAPKPALFMCP